MPRNLVEFWRRFVPTGSRYAHPEDEKAIERSGLEHPQLPTLAAYNNAMKEGRLEPKKLHLTLYPQPYLGNIVDAPIVVLLLNPGLHANDFYLEAEHPEFRSDLLANLRQSERKHLFLDPKWSWTTGFDWWERKFRSVAQEIAARKPGWNYGDALSWLSENVASLEMVPYHSISSGAPTTWPSSAEAKRAAKQIASDPARTVIVTRSVATWDLPNQDNVKKYSPGQARGASLGPNSKGGQAILGAFAEKMG